MRSGGKSSDRLPQTISARDAEARTGLSRSLLRKWRKLGLIDGVVIRTPGCTRGGVLLLYLESLERFLESRGLRLRDRAA